MSKAFSSIKSRKVELNTVLDFGHYCGKNTSTVVLENYRYFKYLESVGYSLSKELKQAIAIQEDKEHKQLLSEIEEDIPF